MVMDFRVRDAALLRPLKPGQEVDFEIIEELAGEYFIVRIQPAASGPAVSPHANSVDGNRRER